MRRGRGIRVGCPAAVEEGWWTGAWDLLWHGGRLLLLGSTMRHTDAAPIDTLILRCIPVGRDRLDLPKGRHDHHRTPQLHVPDADSAAIRASLDGLGLAAT